MATVVDAHSHIFNAQDLPIDGFLRRQQHLPSVLRPVVGSVLDGVLRWAADGPDEAEYLIDVLRSLVEGVESPLPQSEAPDLPDDALLDMMVVDQWPDNPARPPSGEEGPDDRDPLADRIDRSTPAQRADLEMWLLEVGDPEYLEAREREGKGPEGPADLIARANSIRRWLHNFVGVLRLASRYRHRIAATLASTYPEVELYVPALVDFTYTTSDDPSTDVGEQIAIHSLLAKLSMLGGITDAENVRLHPMVGFCPYREVEFSELEHWLGDHGDNPYVPYADVQTAQPLDRFVPSIRFDPSRARGLRRPEAPWHLARLRLSGVNRSLDLVRHAIEVGGFVGVKVYPPSGYLPLGNTAPFGAPRGPRLDAALRAFYGYCEPMDVPILTHAAHSIGFGEGYDDFAGPAGWRAVLADYPGLRLSLGHFGHMYEPKTAGALRWAEEFIVLIDEYDHVYADLGNSRMVFDECYRAEFLAMLTALLGSGDNPSVQQLKRRRRLMFGSDYWLNNLGLDFDSALTLFRQEIGHAFGPQTRDDFLGGNALRFLGVVDEDGQPDPTNRNRQRLIDFYGNQPRPSWLA